MKKILLFCLLLLQALFNNCFAADTNRISVKYANRYIDYDLGNWNYAFGALHTAIERLWHVTLDSNYYNTIKQSKDLNVTDYGELKISSSGSLGFIKCELDDIRAACQLLTLFKITADEKYKIAADTIWNYLTKEHLRTEQGGFWHKCIYSFQMWLDGIYMSGPFYAEYNNMFNKTDYFDDVVLQITEIDAHTWDAEKKLHYHGWYSGHPDYWFGAYWADTITGTSPYFWGRAIGWYAMGIVDVLDYLPREHPQRDSVIGIFNRLAEGIAMYQDPDSLVWWQIVDQAKRDSNWIESSASCMYVYALAKGVRMGYLDTTYLEVAKTGYQGILDKFLVTDYEGKLRLTDVCVGTGVDNRYSYYVGRPALSGLHGDAPFIMASTEIELIDSIYPPGPLGIDSIVGGAINLSWKINRDTVSGFILERRETGPFTLIANLPCESPFYADTTVEPNTTYQYRLCSYNKDDTSSYSNTLQVKSTNAEGLPSPAYLPWPADSSVGISSDQILKWRKGLLTKSHKLYFGTTNPPPFIADMDIEKYDPDTLYKDSTYYWRIDEVNDKGTTEGEVWKFEMSKSATIPSLSAANNFIHVYPNPANVYINVRFNISLNIRTINLYDNSGRLIRQIAAEKFVDNNETIKIPVSNLQHGFYILKLEGDDRLFYQKIMICR